MIVYAPLFIVAALAMLFSGMIGNRKITEMLGFVIILGLVIVSGTRYHLGGYDYQNYVYMFKQAPSLAQFNLIDYIKLNGLIGNDIGWTLLNSLIKSLGMGFYGLTMFVALFFWLSMFFGLKKFFANINVLIVIVFYKYFLDMSFVYMRQSIAVALFIIALPALRDRKIIRYMILVILAASVHFSAIILIPLYWIGNIKLSKKKVISYSIIFTFSFVASLMHIDVMSIFSSFANLIGGTGGTKISEAAAGNLYGGNATNILHLLEFWVLNLFLLLKYETIDLGDKSNALIIRLFLILLPIYSLFAGSPIMVRDGFYFLFTYAILLDLLTKNVTIKNRLVTYMVIATISFYGMYRFATNFDNGASYHYDSFLMHKENLKTNVNVE
ncbi:EpsG family protein [Periweissella cryptocerci]|uniref:EpsG family protein n=1 Tax=Periweissella cryptocerci TaxID=2506420 RepID=A0A4P6YWE9_9LACO|nr:EpsG family protein [Periweissella cryptocerci]QBO37077.1 EpsG family protein [Periweissella cryptocerci]